jgi:hypothetical protein
MGQEKCGRSHWPGVACRYWDDIFKTGYLDGSQDFKSFGYSLGGGILLGNISVETVGVWLEPETHKFSVDMSQV